MHNEGPQLMTNQSSMHKVGMLCFISTGRRWKGTQRKASLWTTVAYPRSNPEKRQQFLWQKSDIGQAGTMSGDFGSIMGCKKELFELKPRDINLPANSVQGDCAEVVKSANVIQR